MLTYAGALQRARDDCARVEALLASAQRLLDADALLPASAATATTAAATATAAAAGETTAEALAKLARAESDAREAAALVRGMCASSTELVRAEGVRLTPAAEAIEARVTARLECRSALSLARDALRAGEEALKEDRLDAAQVYVYMYVYISTHIHTYIYIYICIYIYMYACVCIYIYVCICVDIYICMYVCVYIYMYVYV
jgi:hypothetical protein